MSDFIEEVLIPFNLVILVLVGISIGVYAILGSQECKRWGGDFSISAGCLMEYSNKTLTLEQYKEINLKEITHLYLLLINNENENFCYGNPTDWWDKHLTIKEKIQELVSKGE